MSEPEIPRRFYDDGLSVLVYDAQYETILANGPVAGDVDFYVELARELGGPVIEVACGTGRVTWPIARAGVDVVGFDLSPGMLRLAEAKRAREDAEVAARATFVHADMESFDLGITTPLMIVPFRAFQVLLTPDAQRRALTCMRRHLEPGGRLVIDAFDPMLEYLVGVKSPETSHSIALPERGTRCEMRVDDRVYDPFVQRLTETWTLDEFDANDDLLRSEREVLQLRWTYRHEFRHLFELCGFEVEAEYSDFHRSPPAYGKELLFVARRVD